jgi:quinoprotein glucose dehydrogenase
LSEAADGASDVERLGLLLALRRLHDPGIKQFLNDPNPELILSAARAINDEPLEELTFELAQLVGRSDLYSYDPLVRRVIHAAFRLGTGDLAEAVAQIAASESVSPAVRLFAAEALVDWNEPGPLDRVNGSWRPFERDPLENIADQLRPHLAGMLSADRKLRAIGIKLAANYGLKDVNPLLWALFENEEEPVANRVAALSALDALDAEKLDEGVQAALDSEIPELRAMARTILVRQDPAGAFPYLLEAIASGTTLEKQQGIDALDAMNVKPADDVLANLMKLLLKGSLPAEIQLDVLEAAQERKQEPFSALVEEYQTQLAEKNDPLAKYRITLEGGDKQRGYDIFFGRSDASCRRCHKVNGSGGDVGPDLSKIGADKERQYLLEALVNPNAKIAKGFETAILVTDSGKVITGIVKEETDDHLSVMLNDGTPVRVNKDEIEERAPGRSGMPDDLIKHLSLSDVRDLVEYLSSLKTAGEGSQGHE